MTVAVIPFEPDRFRTAAAHYVSGRPDYSPRLIARVAERTGLQSTDRVLDLGCGPGMLARAFAPRCAEVIAIDPEPAMLEQAQAGPLVANIIWRQGSSYDIGPELGPFRLCTMGRSFHWMDRADTLRRLDAMLVPGGAVALFHDVHPDVPDNAWHADWDTLLKRYAAPSPRKGLAWVRHEAVLLDSPFAVLEQISVIERRRTPAPALIDRALSMSSSSPSKLGARREEFLRELTEFVNGIATEGMVTEVVATNALMAWRD